MAANPPEMLEATFDAVGPYLGSREKVEIRLMRK
jgi:hypothetical protein